MAEPITAPTITRTPPPGTPPPPAAPPVAPVAKPVAAAPVPAPPPAKPVVTDDAFAALAAKEKAFAASAQKLSTDKAAFAAQQAEYTSWKAARESRLRDPDAFLRQDFGEGWYDKLTEYKLNGGKVTPELVSAQVDERFAALTKQQDDERAKALDAEKARTAAEQQQAWQKFQEDTKGFVESKPDDYELINLHGAHASVVAVIEKTYADTGRVLDAKEAADQVEKYLEEQIQKSLETKKWKSKAQLPPAAPGAEKRPESAQPRTLTNAHAAITTPPPPSGPLTEAERMARAIAAGEAVRKARQTAA